MVNCAGLESDHIAESMGIDINAHHYQQFFWKGEYFSLALEPGVINRLVYPVPLPNNEGLGIHATVDMGGRIKLGPNAIFLLEKNYIK